MWHEMKGNAKKEKWGKETVTQLDSLICVRREENVEAKKERMFWKECITWIL